MKKNFLIVVMLLSVIYANSQIDSIKRIKYKFKKIEYYNFVDTIIKKSVIKYNKHDGSYNKTGKGVIIVKILDLEEKSCIFSLRNIINRKDIYNIGSVTNYFDLNGQLVLVKGGSYQDILLNEFKYKIFKEQVFFSQKYISQTYSANKFASRDWYIVEVIHLKKRKAKIEYYRDMKVPEKYL